MNSTSSSKLWILIAVVSLLSSCSQDPEKRGREATENLSATTSTSNTTSTSTINTSGTETPATPTTSSQTSTDTSSVATPTSSGPDTTSTIASQPSDSTPQPAATADKAKVNINLNELPSDVPICSVAGQQITVGDYKRMMRIQQTQANQAIVSDPAAKGRLLKEATTRGITLTDEEKKKLIEAAHQQKGVDKKAFADFLKETKSTEQQFDDEIVLTGLAFKTSNAVIESTLLPELVNRALLAQAAKQSGGEKTAMNKYLSFKGTKAFEALKQQTGLSDDALKEEVVSAELAKLQLAKVEAQVKVADAEVKKLYDANKAQLKHGERIRLSTILIMCPEKDIGPIQSVKTQIAKANPKLSEKEVETATTNFMEQAKQKILVVLGQAKGGADFAKLANESSNDPLTMSKKNGGDMGFIEKKDIIPALGDVVFKLKPGQILEQVVKSELGYNIYKVTGKEGPGPYKFEDVKPKLAELAKSAKGQQMLLQWLEQRRKMVKVEFTPKFLAIANGSKSATK